MNSEHSAYLDKSLFLWFFYSQESTDLNLTTFSTIENQKIISDNNG